MSGPAFARLFTERSLACLRDVADVVDADIGALGDVELLRTGGGCPPVDEVVLAAAPRLRAIVHAAGSAKRHVTPACWARGIVVSTAAEANAQPVAEDTLAMILLANKAAPAPERAYRERRARHRRLGAHPPLGDAP